MANANGAKLILKPILILLLAVFVHFSTRQQIALKAGRPITNMDYEIDRDAILKFHSDAVTVKPPEVLSKFVQLLPDDETNQFLVDSADALSTRSALLKMQFKQLLVQGLQKVLGWSRPDARGFMGVGTLYVASEKQLEAVLRSVVKPNQATKSILDIGSGTGTETAKLATLLGVVPERVLCLESSKPLQKKLQSRGFTTADGSIPSDSSFSFVSLLNVLDRTDDPHGLLRSAIGAVDAGGGTILMAAVLPFQGIVHGKFGSKRRPFNGLKIRGSSRSASFELGFFRFIEAIASEHPELELVSWSRLPYLSSGDTRRTHYTLDMAVMAWRVKELKDGEERVKEIIGEEVLGTVEAEGFSGIDVNVKACGNRRDDDVYAFLASTLRKDGVAFWRDVLDAGAGMGSMCWLLRQGQKVDRIIEVTAASDGTYGSNMLLEVSKEVEKVVVEAGNWRDDEFLKGRTFDVVVADYLLGAVELHWAHGADGMMDRLVEAAKVGGYLLISGLEPYEMVLDRGNDDDRLVLDIEAIGESAAFVAGESTYREIPETWVLRQIGRLGKFRVVDSQQFDMRLTVRSLMKQISYAKDMARKISDADLRKGYLTRVATLERELKSSGGEFWGGRNYAIVVQRVK
ncbi:hypothetical protein TrST_g12946 [Triparma strigata]|uniref:Methyltransferase type 11 domain-containing protein n=1 Tax=Triparma strigata TaxID=1606541 RepID=A0A9W7BPA4_9STRA|nr:hypothetical protein TrST_g12946 [Triparma strigata]